MEDIAQNQLEDHTTLVMELIGTFSLEQTFSTVCTDIGIRSQ
jgi:hypothetical protein